MLSVIAIKSHLVNVFNNNRPNSKQTLILPVHIKSQLSYILLSLRNFVFASFVIFEKTRRKPEYRRAPEKCEWFHDHDKIVLKVHKIVPRGGDFVYFCLPRGRDFAKIFCPEAANLITLKEFPRGQPGGDIGAWN